MAVIAVLGSLLLIAGQAAAAHVVSNGAESGRVQRVTLRGTLLVRHGDAFRLQRARYAYWLKTGSSIERLLFRSPGPSGLGRDHVSVSGVRVGSVVHVRPGHIDVLDKQQRIDARNDASGTSKLAIFLINFKNDTRQ